MVRLLAIRTIVAILGTSLAAGCGGSSGGGSSDQIQPVITAGTPPPGTTGAAYVGYTFTVASGGVAPFTWSETGALPPGLSLSPTGQVTGVPTHAATYPLTVMVTDSSVPALTASNPYSVKISDSKIVVSPASTIPAGATNVQYAGFQFSVASGGSPPFTWSLTSGAPPPGLTLASDGWLSGTPTSAATYTFTATATDSASPAGTGAVLVSVKVSSPPTINSIAPPTATVGTPYSSQFTVTGGLAPFVWSASGMMYGLGVGANGDLSGTPTSAGHFPITVDVQDFLLRNAATAHFTMRIALSRPAGAFTATGSLVIARAGHTATLLKGGKVLVTGGIDSAGHALASTELYDPLTGTFTLANPMTEARNGHSATLLANAALPKYGEVLILGSGDDTAELYDPVAGTFTATGKMVGARLASTATLLNTGKVLIVGGNSTAGDLRAELYDPTTGTFAATGSLSVFRAGHTATLLLDGRVLVAGGVSSLSAVCCTLASAEIYDPATGSFGATGSMTEPRTGHSATRIQDGTVLIVSADDTTADLFDPGTGMFVRVGDLPALATGSTASLLGDGTVLVAGGYRFGPPITNHLVRQGVCTSFPESFPMSDGATALFAPESQGFTSGSSGVARAGHTTTVLGDGTLLLIGGVQFALQKRVIPTCQYYYYTTTTSLSSAQLYK